MSVFDNPTPARKPIDLSPGPIADLIEHTLGHISAKHQEPVSRCVREIAKAVAKDIESDLKVEVEKREALGVINLDPSSCEVANENVKAEKICRLYDNGLDQPWAGNVWLNPPYCQLDIVLFTTKLIY